MTNDRDCTVSQIDKHCVMQQIPYWYNHQMMFFKQAVAWYNKTTRIAWQVTNISQQFPCIQTSQHPNQLLRFFIILVLCFLMLLRTSFSDHFERRQQNFMKHISNAFRFLATLQVIMSLFFKMSSCFNSFSRFLVPIVQCLRYNKIEMTLLAYPSRSSSSFIS